MVNNLQMLLFFLEKRMVKHMCLMNLLIKKMVSTVFNHITPRASQVKCQNNLNAFWQIIG
jgi:hypothetical protein